MEKMKLGRKIFKEKNIDEFVKDFGFADVKNYGDLLLLDYDREYDSDTLVCHAYITEKVQFFVSHSDSLHLYYNDVLGGCVRK